MALNEHAGDLWLAQACARGEPAALAQLDKRLRKDVSEALARAGVPSSLREDVWLQVREQLLVGSGGAPPKITGYLGRGPLSAWVCVSAVRAGLRLRKSEQRHAGARAVDEMEPTASNADPEASYIKARYRSAVSAALRDALAALSDREQDLLRLHFVDALSVDRIGEIYGAHRSTAARWIVKVREKVFDETRRLILERLQVRGSELGSIVRAVKSQLDLSIRGCLRK